jgi:phosphinothricin acetyltransferase
MRSLRAAEGRAAACLAARRAHHAAMDSVAIRPAAEADVAAITAIYAHHVRHGTGSFETDPPDAAEIRTRWDAIRDAGLPYLVAVDPAGSVLGFAYAGPYRTRVAYRDTVEDSVYVRHDAGGHGIGHALLADVIAACTALGRRQMVAVVGDSANTASVALHLRLGFRQVGVLRSVGYKHGRWLDTVLLQRSLGAGDGSRPGPPA